MEKINHVVGSIYTYNIHIIYIYIMMDKQLVSA